MRPLPEIQAALKEHIAPEYLATRKQGGSELTYIPWHKAVELLDIHAPGWQWQITTLSVCGDRLVLIGRLTIPTAQGDLVREATGTELLDCGSYGDPSSNAESMAFRRAAAKFGLGLWLYDKATPAPATASSKPATSRPPGWTPKWERARA
ncbi:MAG: DUF1071 domain-containing protein [Synechococcaceae cyanobacterium SM2_3_2]|nr:DUF1071 domain-containing protein [Synechococcaceae cyanobacterium SM2_3_2]